MSIIGVYGYRGMNVMISASYAFGSWTMFGIFLSER